MRSRHFKVLAFCALLFAAAALFVALLPTTRAANAAAAENLQQIEAATASDTPQLANTSPFTPTFNYQGYLRNPDGSLMNGSHNITIKIYDAAAGGTKIHDETFSTPVRDGLFNVVLGDNTDSSLPEVFGSTTDLFIGVTVDGATELTPRQRVHPVPRALLADKATTLVPNASVEGLTVEGLTLNGQTTLNGSINGNTNVKGTLRVNDQPPILVKKYRNLSYGNDSYLGHVFDTGISVDDYTCTMGGWEVEMDINETNAGEWSRWVYSAPVLSNPTWLVKFESRIHGTPAEPPVSFDLVCFRNEIIKFEVIGDAVQATAIGPDNASGDAAPTSEDTGQ